MFTRRSSGALREAGIGHSLTVKYRHAVSHLSAVSTCTIGPTTSQKQQQPCVPPVKIRQFHATRRQEILPLIGAAATVFVIGRYSIRALQRMNAEWEDYQWELQQYEKQQKAVQRDAAIDETKTIAIDLGSVFTKLAASQPTEQVIVSREGDRAFFNGIVYETSTTEERSVVARGRHALERYYYRTESSPQDAATACPVTLPWDVMGTDLGPTVVADVLEPALTEVLERLDYKHNDDGEDDAAFRGVVTLPVRYYLDPDTYRSAFSEIASTFLPEPVAAIWGAQKKFLLPAVDETGRTTLVIDVGGHTTQLSVVKKDMVLSSIALPWGGERWIQLLVDLLIRQHNNDDGNQKVSLQDARSLAALQMQARVAVAELSSKTRVEIHVPYLFAEPGNHHLDATIARNVWEQTIQEDIRERLVQMPQIDSALSPYLPTPTDMASLWMSAATQVLELAETIPLRVDHVLLVGGASRAPLVTSSLVAALDTLVGVDAQKRLVVPESTLAPELTVLGAATLLPAYEYSLEDGGLRRRDNIS